MANLNETGSEKKKRYVDFKPTETVHGFGKLK
jgi:hypothetical protein